jgi:nuclear GTP-binding protein
MVINDFLRGKVPWYLPDPSWPERKPNEKVETFEGRSGRLGEMPQNEAKDDDDVSDAESWDGLDVESESGESGEGDSDNISEGENEEDSDEEDGDENTDEDEDDGDDRIEDPRPPKKVRR